MQAVRRAGKYQRPKTKYNVSSSLRFLAAAIPDSSGQLWAAPGSSRQLLAAPGFAMQLGAELEPQATARKTHGQAGGDEHQLRLHKPN